MPSKPSNSQLKKNALQKPKPPGKWSSTHFPSPIKTTNHFHLWHHIWNYYITDSTSTFWFPLMLATPIHLQKKRTKTKPHMQQPHATEIKSRYRVSLTGTDTSLSIFSSIDFASFNVHWCILFTSFERQHQTHYQWNVLLHRGGTSIYQLNSKTTSKILRNFCTPQTNSMSQP